MLNIAFGFSLLLVLFAGLLAFVEGNFSSAQMRAKGVRIGFPFLRHSAMWGNVLLMPFALGIMWKYAPQWASDAIWQKLLIGVIVSIVLHLVWSKMTDRQEHICGPNFSFTASGLVNAFHLAGAIAIALLFYMNTPQIQAGDAGIVTTLLMIYLPLANAFVGYMKSGHFDAPGVIGTIALEGALIYAHFQLT